MLALRAAAKHAAARSRAAAAVAAAEGGGGRAVEAATAAVGSEVAVRRGPEALRAARASVRGAAAGAKAGRSDRQQGLTFYDKTVEQAAMKEPTEYTIREMLEFGGGNGGEAWSPYKTLQFGRYVHRELPIRLARRLMDLHQLPYVVVTNPHIMSVYSYYLSSFRTLNSFPELKTVQDSDKFTKVMLRLVDESVPLLGVMARGIRECMRKPIIGETLQLQGFLQTILHTRIARRCGARARIRCASGRCARARADSTLSFSPPRPASVIAEQYVALQQPRDGFIGVFERELNVGRMIEKASTDCEAICETTYGRAPAFELRGDTDATLCYIPAHLEYCLFEVFKNSSRAVCEKHSSAEELPPVQVLVFKHDDDESVSVKVSDQGGGIDAKSLQKVFEYGFTTVPDDLETFSQEHDASGTGGGLGALGSGGGTGLGGLGAQSRSPMAGLGAWCLCFD